MMTGLVVLKIVLMPSRTRLASLANSGPRWSMIGVSMARRMRSGTGDGPGIWRKWRPATRDEFWAIGSPFLKTAQACRLEHRMQQSGQVLTTGRDNKPP